MPRRFALETDAHTLPELPICGEGRTSSAARPQAKGKPRALATGESNPRLWAVSGASRLDRPDHASNLRPRSERGANRRRLDRAKGSRLHRRENLQRSRLPRAGGRTAATCRRGNSFGGETPEETAMAFKDYTQCFQHSLNALSVGVKWRDDVFTDLPQQLL